MSRSERQSPDEARVFNADDVQDAFRSGRLVSVPILSPGKILRVYGPGVITSVDLEKGVFSMATDLNSGIYDLRIDEIVDQPTEERKERRDTIWDWIIAIITAPTR